MFSIASKEGISDLEKMKWFEEKKLQVIPGVC